MISYDTVDALGKAIYFSKGLICGGFIGIMVGAILMPILLTIGETLRYKTGYLAGWVDRDKNVPLKPVRHHTDNRIFTVGEVKE